MLAYSVTRIVILSVFALSAIKTSAYNRLRHHETFSGAELFSADTASSREVSVKAIPRSSTWGKIFDFNDEGLTENNYQAYTYDFTISNGTKDEVREFTFTLTFSQEAFPASAWNGALEIHQNVNGGELVNTVPDLREFDPSQHSLKTFTGFIDAKDPYTNGHSKRVAVYTKRIAGEMGYSGEELDRIYYVALLHDCGKIGVPDSILGKPGKLTDEEYEIIKSHTVRGGEILSSFKSLKNVGEGALYHHERYDGKGYPEGRAGEDIPLIARMICVADSFDAMNTNRVYRKKLSKEGILEEIERNKGRQFDPEIADIMIRLIRDGRIAADA